MLKAKDFFDSMIETYSASENPPIIVEDVGKKDSECYEIQCVEGNVTLRANNPFGAILGWKRAMHAAQTGFIRENLGTHEPRFPLRIFQGAQSEIGSAIKLGYNAILCKADEDVSTYRDMGLKVFIAVKDPETDFNHADGIWVESNLVEEDEMKTRSEVLEEDLANWEARTGGEKTLIYQLVHGTEEAWTRFFWELCLKAKKGTILAFPASCPDGFWKRLRQSLDIMSTPMLVVMDHDCDLSDRLVDHAFCGGLSKNSKPQFFLN